MKRLFLLVTLGASHFLVATSFASDPFSTLQWGLSNRGEFQAVELDHMNWRWTPGIPGEDLRMSGAPHKATSPVIVAVLDTGVDKNHPDLANRIVRKESECQALAKFEACIKETDDRKSCEKKWMDLKNPEVDLDQNGYPLDCSGWSLIGGLNPAGIMGKPDFGDSQGHGTHVAGIIAAESDNDIGIQGCSRNAMILPVQLFDKNPKEPIKPLSTDLPPELSPVEKNRRAPQNLADTTARAIIYAIHSGAQVINFSMGWPQSEDSELVRKAIEEAQRRGIIIVASAGNDSTGALIRPCSYPGVICVAAHRPDGALTHFTNHGSGVDVAAPGLNILSTWPTEKRPIRFRSQLGYEFLHGTSQAAPFVSCLAAEMLARGYSASEIYPRLILGSRPAREPQSLYSGGPHEAKRAIPNSSGNDDKSLLGGNVDLAGSLSVGPRPLILPVSKERVLINWDRKSDMLRLPFELKNYWAETSQEITLHPRILGTEKGGTRPQIVEVKRADGSAQKAEWQSGEKRSYEATLRIVDTEKPGQSRIESYVDLEIEIQIDGKSQGKFVVGGEIVVPVTKTSNFDDASMLGLNLPRVRYSSLPIDQNLDSHLSAIDYLLVETNKTEWKFHLLSQGIAQGRTVDPLSSAYEIQGVGTIPAPADPDKVRPQITTRMDIDFDGQSDYVIGLIEDHSRDDEYAPSPLTLYVFDHGMRLKFSQAYDAKIAPFPFQLNGSQLQWMKLGERKVPAWIGYGKDPDRKASLRDLWENPEQYEAEARRFYYFDQAGKVRALEKFENHAIVDLLQPTAEAMNRGAVSVLLARDTGNPSKPSYILDFARAEIIEGKVQNFRPIQFSSGYQNLLDTRVDSILSLSDSPDMYYGTFWFGPGKIAEQKVSILLPESDRTRDEETTPLRKVVDAALWVRGVFASQSEASAFVLTNSEIQFHDFVRSQSCRTSFERYTFYDDSQSSNFHYPIVVRNGIHDVPSRLPGLYKIENFGFERGVKILVPHYSGDRLIELSAPARLRFHSQRDCRPMETPVWLGPDKGYYFDYFCGDRIQRIPLSY